MQVTLYLVLVLFPCKNDVFHVMYPYRLRNKLSMYLKRKASNAILFHVMEDIFISLCIFSSFSSC